NIESAEFKRKLRRVGSNDQNKTKKDLFLKTKQDSAIVNLCISAALVARAGLGFEENFDNSEGFYVI
ncbi:13624_t:CDS:2, partial [Entrophospora sp. SA101]